MREYYIVESWDRSGGTKWKLHSAWDKRVLAAAKVAQLRRADPKSLYRISYAESVKTPPDYNAIAIVKHGEHLTVQFGAGDADPYDVDPHYGDYFVTMPEKNWKELAEGILGEDRRDNT